MSAFMLGDRHHDAVLSYLIERRNYPLRLVLPIEAAHRFGLKTDGGLGDGKSVLVSVTPENATGLGRLLITANAESIAARYRGDRAGFAQAEGYRYRRLPASDLIRLTPVMVLKALDCFDYQACEVPDYDTSTAALVIAAFRKATIAALPGYDDADAWGLDRFGARAA